MNLGKNTKIVRVSNAEAAATTDINSTGVDTQGFNGVMFMVLFGTITASAVTSIHAEQSSDDGSSDAYADLTGTNVAVADDDDNQIFWLDINRPLERYVRCVVDRGTQNAVVDGIVAVLYDPIDMPTTHDATTVGGGEVHSGVAEGTI